MFLEVPDLLTADEVARLRQMAESARFVDGKMSNPASIKNNLQQDPADPAYRTSSALVHAAMMRNARVNDFTLAAKILPPLLTRHEVGMNYGLHADNAFMSPPPQTFRADISCTVFLSDPGRYEGGELCVHLGTRAVLFKMPPGGAIFYPSSTLHEVRPVTSGQRLVAITFIESQIASNPHREMLYELGEVLTQDGQALQWQNRVKLSVVRQALIREWS